MEQSDGELGQSVRNFGYRSEFRIPLNAWKEFVWLHTTKVNINDESNGMNI